jgi:hypothetical protein
MELAKKTTILFPPDLYQQLAALARDRRSSVGELVRSACRAQYGLADRLERLSAVAELAGLALPVGSVQQMERESVPKSETDSVIFVDSNVLP